MVTVGRNVNIRERLPLRRPLQDPFPKQTFFSWLAIPFAPFAALSRKMKGEEGKKRTSSKFGFLPPLTLMMASKHGGDDSRFGERAVFECNDHGSIN